MVVVYVAVVAPLIATPSLYHWYCGAVPVAVTLKLATVGEQIDCVTGCTVIAIASFTTKVAVLEVTVLHVPVTVTVYVPAFEV